MNDNTIAGILVLICVIVALGTGYYAGDRAGYDRGWSDGRDRSVVTELNITARVYDDSNFAEFTVNGEGEHFTDQAIHGSISPNLSYREFSVSVVTIVPDLERIKYGLS